MSFYDEVLRELIAAIGAALLLANVLALARRDRNRALPAGRAVRSAKAKGSSRVRATGRVPSGDLVRAPVARSVAFAVLGFVMMVAGIATLAAG